MRTQTCVAVIVAALTGVGVSAQVPTVQSLRTGTGAISGRVLDAHSGEPLANVMVTLTAPRVQGGIPTTTDIEGYYHFNKLAEHDYQIRIVMDPLYLQACHGATDPDQLLCGVVAVSRDQHRTGIDLRVNPSAILRGRVVDENGRPVGGAMVRASLGPLMPTAGILASAQTKPDGTFELRDLASGDAILALDMPATVHTPRPPRVFYPGVLAAEDAQAIRVTGGLVTADVTFRYPKIANRSLTVRISTPAAGATDIRAWLYRIDPRMTREIPLNADSEGSVGGLLEGRYFVAAQARAESEGLTAFETADLLHDTVELGLLLQEPGRITGRVVAERDALPPLSGVQIAANWIDDEGVEIDPVALSEFDVAPDGSFRIDGVFGLRSLKLLGLPAEWQVQSIKQGRTEIPTAGLSVPLGTTLDLVVTVSRR